MSERKYGGLTLDELRTNVRVLRKTGCDALANCFDDLLARVRELEDALNRATYEGDPIDKARNEARVHDVDDFYMENDDHA